jgi:hypothetical protein
MRFAALLALACCTRSLVAQASDELNVGLAATPVFTHILPAPGGAGTVNQVNLVAPWIMLDGSAYEGRLRFTSMVNFEGATIPDGVPTPGAWGEGFVDRRHPHTYAHEVILTASQPFAPEGQDGVSFAIGKGFAPFGSDDPMTRPFLAYPVNHHLAQILERLVAVAAVRVGPVTAEAGVFDGDEPTKPSDWPMLSRFGDSWSGRLTLAPVYGVELQGSYADVASPEHRDGGGLDQTKWSTSARIERATAAGQAYGLIEWARTVEGDDLFTYHSVLAEAALRGQRFGIAYRFERTERPEEQRADEPFRTVRPQLDNSILGRTRWSIHTIDLDAALADRWPGIRFAPFVEIAAGKVTSLTPAGFDPVSFYGRDTFWSVSAGVRIAFGMRLHRMGRYGVALPAMPVMQGAPSMQMPAMGNLNGMN